MLDETGKTVVRDPYAGKTYSQVVSLVDLRKLYHEKPHPLRRVPGVGKVWWDSELGRWVR